MHTKNDKLITPLTEENPAGDFLYYDAVYDLIREARREEDPDLPQGVWETERKKADWGRVETLCREVLTKQSKDLQIALWLVESRIAQQGWSALSEGFLFLKDFSSAHWATMHPHIEENGNMDHRLSSLFLFAEKIPDRLVLLPLSAPEDGRTPPLTLALWRMVQYQAKVDKKANEALKDLTKGLLLTPRTVIENFCKTISEAQEALQDFGTSLDILSQNASPSFKRMFDVLKEAMQLLNDTLKRSSSIKMSLSSSIKRQEAKQINSFDKEPLTPPKKLLSIAEAEKYTSLQETFPSNLEEITEAQAYKKLMELTQFFEQHFPQSPIPLLLKSALIVAKIPFELLIEKTDNLTETPLVYIAHLWASLKRYA
ncbi:MAG: type VI secretion system protein TssA [Holosporales bacterium]|jgi:type VI secretion system ImpA family protein|nr:type VI secretion system protein TssA [Holosporales bacterium]